MVELSRTWIPAYAGMTGVWLASEISPKPHEGKTLNMPTICPTSRYRGRQRRVAVRGWPSAGPAPWLALRPLA